MRLALSTFKGSLPAVEPRLLPLEVARDACNCDVQRGHLAALKAPGAGAAAEAGTQSIFWFDGQWMQWGAEVSPALLPVTGAARRLGWTGEDMPHQTDEDAAPVARRLGVPAPVQALTVTLLGDAGSDTDRTTSYVYTVVTAAGEESAPSPASPVVTIMEGQHTRLDGFAVPDGANADKLRIYRAAGDSESAAWRFVDEVAATTDSYEDTTSDADLSVDVLESENFDLPPNDLRGLICTDNGVVAGFVGNTVRFAEPYYPHGWPIDYETPLESDVVGLGWVTGAVVAVTKTRPYLLAGSDPASVSVQVLPYDQGCVSASSVVNVPGAVVFASSDGLFMVTASGGELLTESAWTREQWRAMPIADLSGVYFQGAYYGFFRGTNTGFIFDLSRRDVVRLELPKAVLGLHVRPDTARLYLLCEADGVRTIEEWGAGDSLACSWKSRIFVSENPGNPGAARVNGTQSAVEPVSVRLYADGVLKQNRAVTDVQPYRLPGGYAAREFSVELAGTPTVTGAVIAGSIAEVRGG